jgi:cytoskeletal protein RodZ
LGAFGEKLRKQREQRGLALDAISNTTKISTRMLRALEEEHFDQLPGGVFNKGFVRAYARQVGLDEEETVTDYLTALRESQVQSQKILPDFRGPGAKPNPITSSDPHHHVLPASEHPRGDGKDNGSHDLAASERRRREERRNEVRRTQDRDRNDKAPVLVATRDKAGVNAAGRGDGSHESASLMEKTREQGRGGKDKDQVERHRNADQPQYGSSSLPGFITPAPTTESSNDSPDGAFPRISKSMLAAAVILLLTLALAVWNSQRHRDNPAESAAKPALSPTQPASSAPAQSPGPTLASASNPSPKAASASSPARPAATKTSAATPASLTKSPSLAPKPAADAPPADSPPAKSTAPTLAVKPVTSFTLMIRADQTTWISIIADGKPETHETLIAPAHTSVRASRDVTVKVGNAAGVSFQLNGKEFPAQGNVGEVRSYIFDATGIRPGPPSSSLTPNR